MVRGPNLFLSSLTIFHYVTMTKRSNPSNEVRFNRFNPSSNEVQAPPPKRSRRLAGFHLARPVHDIVQPSSSPSSSLFVTVHEERRGSLKAHSQLLSSTPDPSTRASTPAPQSIALETAVEHTYDDNADSFAQVEDNGTKTKRKRHTKNAVRSSSESLCASILIKHQDQLKEWIAFRAIFLDEVLRHDGLGDFLGRTECSWCGKAEGTIKCKDCSSGRMLKCQECIIALHQSLPLHRVEVSLRSLQITLCVSSPTVSNRDGTVDFSTRTLFKTLVFVISLVIPEHLVRVLSRAPRTSLSSTPRALILLQSTTVSAAMKLRRIGPNCYGSNGFQQRFLAHKPSSHSTALKLSTSLLYKGRRTYTIITIPSYDDQIMSVSPVRS
jgi:hypothetical protein